MYYIWLSWIKKILFQFFLLWRFLIFLILLMSNFYFYFLEHPNISFYFSQFSIIPNASRPTSSMGGWWSSMWFMTNMSLSCKQLYVDDHEVNSMFCVPVEVSRHLCNARVASALCTISPLIKNPRNKSWAYSHLWTQQCLAPATFVWNLPLNKLSVVSHLERETDCGGVHIWCDPTCPSGHLRN